VTNVDSPNSTFGLTLSDGCSYTVSVNSSTTVTLGAGTPVTGSGGISLIKVNYRASVHGSPGASMSVVASSVHVSPPDN
jgi:hypothetical protein